MFIGIEASHALKENRTGVEEYCWQIIQELKKIIPAETRIVLYINSRKLKVESRKLEDNDLLDNLPANWSVKELWCGWHSRGVREENYLKGCMLLGTRNR